MAEIDVTMEALRSVGIALNKFQRDMEPFPANIRRHIEELQVTCNSDISKIQKQIEELKEMEHQLECQIDESESESKGYRYEIYCDEQQIQRLEDSISGCQRKIEIEEIEEVPSQYVIAPLSNEISSYEQEIRQKQRNIQMCSIIIDELRRKSEQLQEELRETEKKRYRTEDKLSRLQHAYFYVMQESENLCAAVNKFYKHTMETTEGNISGIKRSISLVEKYMTTNL